MTALLAIYSSQKLLTINTAAGRKHFYSFIYFINFFIESLGVSHHSPQFFSLSSPPNNKKSKKANKQSQTTTAMMTEKVTWRPRIGAATWGLRGGLQPCGLKSYSHGKGHQSQDIIQTQATAKCQVWINGPAAAGVCIDICGLCHVRRPLEPCEMKSEDLSLALEKLVLLLGGHYSKRAGPCTRAGGPHSSPQAMVNRPWGHAFRKTLFQIP